MNGIKFLLTGCLAIILMSFSANNNILPVTVVETSASGGKLEKISGFHPGTGQSIIDIIPGLEFQTITGFGGAFTESSAHLLNRLSRKNRDLILDAYFGTNGAKYSMARMHINSCDFSLGNYSYAPVKGDVTLLHFSIERDRGGIIPMIKDAMARSEEGFKIIASPWTAPPWMKDNNDWKGGKLMPEYYDCWALFLSKFLSAYKEEGIDIWALTVENEPLGNGGNWESMLYTPGEMVAFVSKYLVPRLHADSHHVKILAYDQNRGKELEQWAKAVYMDRMASEYFDGFAVHWYASTFDWFPESLNYTHYLAPGKHLIQSEACVDSEVPHWKDDKWYWSEEATDWGWDWAPADEKALHPKYVPVYRYARDIICCLNNWVDGWVDWNMVLDRQGGPNWANNWCVAPVIVDPDKDEVYFTPLYYTLAHFSRYIRPGAVRIGFETNDTSLSVTAAKNPDGSIAVVVLNVNKEPKNIKILLGDRSVDLQISAHALQTIVILS